MNGGGGVYNSTHNTFSPTKDKKKQTLTLTYAPNLDLLSLSAFLSSSPRVPDLLPDHNNE